MNLNLRFFKIIFAYNGMVCFFRKYLERNERFYMEIATIFDLLEIVRTASLMPESCDVIFMTCKSRKISVQLQSHKTTESLLTTSQLH